MEIQITTKAREQLARFDGFLIGYILAIIAVALLCPQLCAVVAGVFPLLQLVFREKLRQKAFKEWYQEQQALGLSHEVILAKIREL